MNFINVESRFAAAHQSLQIVEQHTKGDAKILLSKAIATLNVTVEELQVAIEEIYAQNQELLETRQALETERQRYQELFEEAPDGYIETDNQGTIARANRTAVTLLGFSQRSLIGKPLDLFIDDSDRDLFRLQIVALERQRTITGWEVNLKPQNSPPVAVELSVSTESHRQAQWRWLVRDLTQRKQAEATQRRLETQTKLSEFKNCLLNSIAHQFRTPLNIVSMSASTMERFFSSMEEEQRQNVVHRMHLAIKYMIQLLEEVEFFHEGDRLNYRAVAIIELEPFCRNSIADLQELIGITHPVELQVHANRPVFFNAKLLLQILRHLIANSIWYSLEGSLIRVTVVCEEDQILLQVQDRGIGIPETDQPHIFEPFYRGSNANKAQIFAGTGLGLAVVKKSVDYSGGAIAFTSKEGCGTTFTVTLPLQEQ